MTDPAAHSPCTPPTPSSPATLARGCLTSVRHSGPLHMLLLCLEPSSQEIQSVHSSSSFRCRLKCHLSRGASLTVLCKCHSFPLHGAYTTCRCVFSTYCIYYLTPSLESGCLKETLSGWGAHPCSGLAFQIWSWGPRTTMAAFKYPDLRVTQQCGVTGSVSSSNSQGDKY